MCIRTINLPYFARLRVVFHWFYTFGLQFGATGKEFMICESVKSDIGCGMNGRNIKLCFRNVGRRKLYCRQMSARLLIVLHERHYEVGRMFFFIHLMKLCSLSTNYICSFPLLVVRKLAAYVFYLWVLQYFIEDTPMKKFSKENI